MRRALTACCCLLAAACGGHTAPATVAAPAPPPLRFGPGSGRYRVEFATTVVQEVMGQSNTIQSSATILATALLAAGADGTLAAAVTVDSVSANSNQPVAVDALRQARGRTYRSVYTPLGDMVSYAGADTTRGAGGVGELFRDFLPVLPQGVITAGVSWTDSTTTSQNPSQGLRLEIKAVRQHRVVGWEPVDGAQALHISTVASYTLHGTGLSQGQPISAEGTGHVTADQFVSPSGVYLSATSSDSTAMTLTLTAMGIDVPVRQTRRGTITRLP